MSMLKEAVRRPYELIHGATDELNGRTPFFHRPLSIGGFILLALALVGVVSMLPELRRYMRIRQM